MNRASPIGIAGTGTVAQALGRLLQVSGAPVVAVAGRDQSRTERAAACVGASTRAVGFAELPALATHVLVAVSDEAIYSVAQVLAAAGMQSGIALHTCGARGPEALLPLRSSGVACGMLHPLQTVASPEQGVTSLVGVTFGVAGDPAAVAWGEAISRQLKGQPLRLAPGHLPLYHAGAVMASNAFAALVDVAATLIAQAGVDRQDALRAIDPLCRTSLDNVLRLGPRAALTGPVARGDAVTVAAHLSALPAMPPSVPALYRAVGRYLVDLARQRGLPQAKIVALEALFDSGHPGGTHESQPVSRT